MIAHPRTLRGILCLKRTTHLALLLLLLMAVVAALVAVMTVTGVAVLAMLVVLGCEHGVVMQARSGNIG